MSSSKFQKYVPSDAYVLKDNKQRPYELISEYNSAHWGQLKLGLMLVQFLTYYWDPVNVPHPRVVYAGAANGTNIGLVSQLFPQIRWYLYDPSPFNIDPEYIKDIIINDKIHKNINIYTGNPGGFFTDESAKEWSIKQKQESNVYFISDIRGEQNMENDNSVSKENEKVVWDNMLSQQRWHQIIRPVYSHLKFRLPFKSSNTSSIFKEYMTYLDGDLYRGIWGPLHSTECRLVPRGYTEKYWNIEEHESKMFYFNTRIRGIEQYYNPFYIKKSEQEKELPIDSNGIELLNDWDSITETWTWINYIIKMYGISNASVKRVNALSKYMSDGINKSMRSNHSRSSRRIAAKIKELIQKRNDPELIDLMLSQYNLNTEQRSIVEKYDNYVGKFLNRNRVVIKLSNKQINSIIEKLMQEKITFRDFES